MINAILPAAYQPATANQSLTTPRLIPKDLRLGQPKDAVEFGKNGPLSNGQAMGIVLDRAYEKLLAVVNQAREELGIPQNAIIDTSPDATAERILNFALGFFDRYAKNNNLEDNEEGRAQFAEFIGAAIRQGISEARDILGALNSLSPDINANINKTADIIQQRLEDFVLNGLKG